MHIGLAFAFLGLLVMVLDPGIYNDVEMSKEESFAAMIMFAGLCMFLLFGARPQDLFDALGKIEKGAK